VKMSNQIEIIKYKQQKFIAIFNIAKFY